MKPEKTNPETAHSAANPGEYLAAGADHAGADSTNADLVNDLVNEGDRLQWLAFCYVADELTTSQRADFESRLSTELKAQEALASVVELGSGVYGNYQNQTQPAHGGHGSTLLERAGTNNSTADRSSTLSRMLLMTAAVLVMAVIGYGLVQESNQSTALKDLDQPSTSPSTSQFSILADEWINGLDEIVDDELEVVSIGELPIWDSEEYNESMIPIEPSEVDGLGVDASLISFYSEMLDNVQEESLLNSRSTREKTGVEL